MRLSPGRHLSWEMQFTSQLPHRFPPLVVVGARRHNKIQLIFLWHFFTLASFPLLLPAPWRIRLSPHIIQINGGNSWWWKSFACSSYFLPIWFLMRNFNVSVIWSSVVCAAGGFINWNEICISVVGLRWVWIGRRFGEDGIAGWEERILKRQFAEVNQFNDIARNQI